MMLATVGMDPQTGTPRFSGDFLFLWDGLSLVTAVLALFAVPEMIALGVKRRLDLGGVDGGREVSPTGSCSRACWRCRGTGGWRCAPRSSARSIGMIPGLGGSAAAWICYGHAVQTSKTSGALRPRRGRRRDRAGDRQQRQGGRLAAADPVLRHSRLSSGMAVLMGAFLILGIQPGPAMITEHLDLVWTLIWALVVGNLIAVSIPALHHALGGAAHLRQRRACWCRSSS